MPQLSVKQHLAVVQVRRVPFSSFECHATKCDMVRDEEVLEAGSGNGRRETFSVQ